MVTRARSIPELPALAAPASDDLLVVVDVSAQNATKKTTVQYFIDAVGVGAQGPRGVGISNTAPTTSIGVVGDTQYQISSDANYLYVCTANYDGSTNIWKRVALSSDTW